MIETGEVLPSDQREKKQALGDKLMTGKVIGLKNGMYLIVFLPQLFQEIEREQEGEKEKASWRAETDRESLHRMKNETDEDGWTTVRR
ncbi:eukaryotic translation initiation factor 3 subunit A [Sigmodon hispidus]